MIDCKSIVQSGNPGIGGTEYEFAMLANYLNSHCSGKSDWELVVFQAGRYEFVDDIHCVTGITQQEMPAKSEQLGIDILIIDSRWPLPVIKRFNTTSVKVIVWCHCVGSIYRHLLFARWNAVAQVVFVSRGHLLNFIDNPVYKKSTYAFNSISDNHQVDLLRDQNPYPSRPHDVVYMGALDSSKGFHVLAKVWKEVLKKVPDAHLHVIGSANLYGSNDVVGKLGIAAQEYENTFSTYLEDEDSNLHPSVILHGQLGDEKYDVMCKCRVGVPNPDGKTETFCICAVEMQLCGCRCVTKYSSGYIDTIPIESNVLTENESELAEAIVESLLDDEFDWQNNLRNIKDNFTPEAVGKKWLEIIKSVYNGEIIQQHLPSLPQFRKRRINANLRHCFPILPPLGLVSDTYDRLKAFCSRHLHYTKR